MWEKKVKGRKRKIVVDTQRQPSPSTRSHSEYPGFQGRGRAGGYRLETTERCEETVG